MEAMKQRPLKLDGPAKMSPNTDEIRQVRLKHHRRCEGEETKARKVSSSSSWADFACRLTPMMSTERPQNRAPTVSPAEFATYKFPIWLSGTFYPK